MFFLLSGIGTFIDSPPSSPPTPHPHERSPVPPLTPVNVFYSPHRGERALDPSRRASSPPRPSWSLLDASYSHGVNRDPRHPYLNRRDQRHSTPKRKPPTHQTGRPPSSSGRGTSGTNQSPIGAE